VWSDAVVHFQLEVLAEVALAMLLGGLIGFERELAERPAGLRTHMMVAGAATLLVAMGDVFLHRVTESGARDLESDPIRIVEAVVTGVSFLGAGAIFRRGGENPVEGLTTAAGILLTAAVGICVALRQIVLAVGVVVMVLAILRGLLWVERRLAARKSAAGHGKT
jgi:putative Mg2+ transporter-C (MgtC) family protein